MTRAERLAPLLEEPLLVVYGRDADAASRVPIEDAGLGWAYGHGLGHGVGVQIHEAPVLRPESTDVLTVE